MASVSPFWAAMCRGGESLVALRIGVGAGLAQGGDGLGVAEQGGGVQGGGTFDVPRVGISAGLAQGGDGLGVAVLGGDVQGGES